MFHFILLMVLSVVVLAMYVTNTPFIALLSRKNKKFKTIQDVVDEHLKIRVLEAAIVFHMAYISYIFLTMDYLRDIPVMVGLGSLIVFINIVTAPGSIIGLLDESYRSRYAWLNKGFYIVNMLFEIGYVIAFIVLSIKRF